MSRPVTGGPPSYTGGYFQPVASMTPGAATAAQQQQQASSQYQFQKVASVSSDPNYKKVEEKYAGLFTLCSGELPFKDCNIAAGQDPYIQLDKIINDYEHKPKSNTSKNCAIALKGLVTIGAYVYFKWVIVGRGRWGFLFDAGKGAWRFLKPGNHNLASMFDTRYVEYDAQTNLIQLDYITIVRVMQGEICLATNNSEPEILMPGLHVRTNPNFKIDRTYKLNQEVIYLNPITIFTVNTGTVRVGFQNGAIKIFDAGRYAINSPNFVPGPVISLQQLTQKLSNHTVLLDGGISLVVEGLVIYQVSQPATLCAQLGVALDKNDIQNAQRGVHLELDKKLYSRMEADIEKVTRAEIARVFAGIHLEDISSQSDLDRAGDPDLDGFGTNDPMKRAPAPSRPATSQAGQRSKICAQILQDVIPILSKWGITLHNFQLESTRIANATYSNEYERASLAMAKAKADCRTQAQNALQTKIAAEASATQKRISAEADAAATRISATVAADALKTRAEAAAKARIVSAGADAKALVVIAESNAKAKRMEAQALADAKRMDGESRGEAASFMQNPFAQELALREQQVAAVAAMKVGNLNVLSTQAIGQSSWVEQLLPVNVHGNATAVVASAPASGAGLGARFGRS